MVQSMLERKKISQEFYGEVVDYAIYLSKHSLNKCMEKTPTTTKK